MPKQVKARAAQDKQEERMVRRLAGSHHAPADWKFHAQMVCSSWAGKAPNEIAAELGCHPQTVRIHLARFNVEGVAGLGMRPGSGRKPRLTEQEGSAQWTLNALAQAAKEVGIRVKRSQIRRIYLREGVQWRRTQSWGDSSDPDARPKRTAVVTHYTEPPEGSTTICTDLPGASSSTDLPPSARLVCQWAPHQSASGLQSWA
jgi:transposase